MYPDSGAAACRLAVGFGLGTVAPFVGAAVWLIRWAAEARVAGGVRLSEREENGVERIGDHHAGASHAARPIAPMGRAADVIVARRVNVRIATAPGARVPHAALVKLRLQPRGGHLGRRRRPRELAHEPGKVVALKLGFDGISVKVSADAGEGEEIPDCGVVRGVAHRGELGLDRCFCGGAAHGCHAICVVIVVSVVVCAAACRRISRAVRTTEVAAVTAVPEGKIPAVGTARAPSGTVSNVGNTRVGCIAVPSRSAVADMLGHVGLLLRDDAGFARRAGPGSSLSPGSGRIDGTRNVLQPVVPDGHVDLVNVKGQSAWRASKVTLADERHGAALSRAGARRGAAVRCRGGRGQNCAPGNRVF